MSIETAHAMVGIDPLQYGPLDGLVLPITLEDVELQLDILADDADIEYRHKEADRLLLLALAIAGSVGCTEHEVADVITAYKKVNKVYA
jgi:hypothetical protein